jgi:hypothetical protein
VFGRLAPCIPCATWHFLARLLPAPRADRLAAALPSRPGPVTPPVVPQPPLQRRGVGWQLLELPHGMVLRCGFQSTRGTSTPASSGTAGPTGRAAASCGSSPVGVACRRRSRPALVEDDRVAVERPGDRQAPGGPTTPHRWRGPPSGAAAVGCGPRKQERRPPVHSPEACKRSSGGRGRWSAAPGRLRGRARNAGEDVRVPDGALGVDADATGTCRADPSGVRCSRRWTPPSGGRTRPVGEAVLGDPPAWLGKLRRGCRRSARLGRRCSMIGSRFDFSGSPAMHGCG